MSTNLVQAAGASSAATATFTFPASTHVVIYVAGDACRVAFNGAATNATTDRPLPPNVGIKFPCVNGVFTQVDVYLDSGSSAATVYVCPPDVNV